MDFYIVVVVGRRLMCGEIANVEFFQKNNEYQALVYDGNILISLVYNNYSELEKVVFGMKK